MSDKHSDETWFTTMLDLYALPQDFPKRNKAPTMSANKRVEFLERAFEEDIHTDTLWRFTAYLQLHEFEALILAKPEAIKVSFPDADEGIAALQADIAGIAPEEVNDGRETAPSKRIIRHIPEYEGLKKIAGTQIAHEIGLPRLRERCPHFHSWIQELERRCRGDTG